MKPKQEKEVEIEKIKELIQMCEDWQRMNLAQATKTYRLFTGDKQSFTFGYNMGIEAVLEKLRGFIPCK